ncbi:MAG: pilus assembly protein PilP [Propionivibrio sp.]|uniref:pilus assembly protein PilP n=1 Tax=Propionivibrio sp. TaxID=2212460 RepID=UPI001A369995|nr:pilus assembly protein PilP [Propionivibrio sp.]MBL8415110.1 pilus assembly protein PilP [Propionivibrio sp.]
MRKLAVALASVALVACSGGDNEDLRQWMDGVSKDIKGTIPPLPQVKPYEPEAYDAGNLLDPFKAAKIGSEQKKSGGGGLQPDMNRPREPLEAYPLESLKYVGVMTRKKNSFAIIQVDGALYQVRVGNYMGQNFGVITKISESEVTLKELIQDSAGDWVEKESTLMLQGQEGKK